MEWFWMDRCSDKGWMDGCSNDGWEWINDGWMTDRQMHEWLDVVMMDGRMDVRLMVGWLALSSRSRLADCCLWKLEAALPPVCSCGEAGSCTTS